MQEACDAYEAPRTNMGWPAAPGVEEDAAKKALRSSYLDLHRTMGLPHRDPGHWGRLPREQAPLAWTGLGAWHPMES